MLQENICLTLLPKTAHGTTQRPTLTHVDHSAVNDTYTGTLVNEIRYDSSKFANAEIEFMGADYETKIVVTRIRGSESDPSPVDLSGSVDGVLDWGSNGC